MKHGNRHINLGKHGMGLYILLTIGLLISLPVAATPIKLTIDRNPVSSNESVQLVFSATEEPDQDPDFSPLQQDFDILNQQRGSNISLLNGAYNKSYTWTLNVLAKHSGTIRIPSIAFGSDQSQASVLVVHADKPHNQDKTPAGQDLFLDVEASPKNPYVQEQVLYTLKLYRRVGIAQASLTEPEADNAVIEKLGEDKNYNTSLNGQNYTVTERKYAIFPQQSGALNIAPLSLTAQIILNKRARFDGFFGSQATRTKRVRSAAIHLDVQTAPDVAKSAYWLPAKQLVLQEKWSGDADNIKVGEPLTRTLTLLANGVTASQLPELNPGPQSIAFAQHGELKNYPDQPVLKEQKKADGIVSLREEKVAYIASKAGVYHLPALEIAWWNTLTQQMEIASIPARTVNAIATSKQTNASSTVPPVQVQNPPPAALPAAAQTATHDIWLWVSVFLACGWLVTVFYFLYKKQVATAKKHVQPKPDHSFIELKQSCRENNAEASKDALITWGRKQFNVSSLSHIAKHCDEPLKEQILLLNECLYNPVKESWDGGKTLLQAFQNAQVPRKQTTSPDAVLQPLYK